MSPLISLTGLMLTLFPASIVHPHSLSSNKAVVRSFFEQILNQKDTSILPSIVSADYKGPAGERGPGGFMESIGPLIAAFPDIHYDIKAMVAEGELVFVQWTWTGTQSAPYRGINAVGKTISNDGMGVFHLRDGKIIQSDVQTDRLGFLQALGVGAPGAASAAAQGGISLIDKFHVPAPGLQEFLERVRVNRTLLETLPGFIRDEAYSHADDQGNITFITVAVWKDQASIDQAKKAVQESYQKEGFNMPAFISRLGITMERGLYEVSN
jgi:steroid delta-isomerase-like uncharacterized protein